MPASAEPDITHAVETARRYFYDDHNYLAAAALLKKLVANQATSESLTPEVFLILGESYHQLATFTREELMDLRSEAIADGVEKGAVDAAWADRGAWRERAEEFLKEHALRKAAE